MYAAAVAAPAVWVAQANSRGSASHGNTPRMASLRAQNCNCQRPGRRWGSGAAWTMVEAALEEADAARSTRPAVSAAAASLSLSAPAAAAVCIDGEGGLWATAGSMGSSSTSSEAGAPRGLDCAPWPSSALVQPVEGPGPASVLLGATAPSKRAAWESMVCVVCLRRSRPPAPRSPHRLHHPCHPLPSRLLCPPLHHRP